MLSAGTYRVSVRSISWIGRVKGTVVELFRVWALERDCLGSSPDSAVLLPSCDLEQVTFLLVPQFLHLYSKDSNQELYLTGWL